MSNILIVEDDENIRNEIGHFLMRQGYKVTKITEFIKIANQIKLLEPNLILLDINLPNESGFAICTEVRLFSDVPIIFVTSSNSNMDELNSIMLGGDAYITKPYYMPILLAKIARLLSNLTNNAQEISIDGVKLFINNYKVLSQGNETELSKNEFKILYLLMKNSNKILSRSEIIEYLWDNELFVDDNTLTVNIRRIRQKLENIGVNNYIKTVRGQGYII